MNSTATYANGYVGKTKEQKNKWRDDIRTSYEKGYSRGWEEAYNIPKRFGSRLAAAYGYSKGIKNRYRSDKYITQYNKQGKQL